MTPEQALACIEQERLDMLCEGATEKMCNMNAAYVLASAYRRLVSARPEALRRACRKCGMEIELGESVTKCSTAGCPEIRGMGIYCASRVAYAPMWLGMVTRGVPIISSWIYEAGEGQTADLSELWERVRDEISKCRALILYVDGMVDFPLKGALVEVGMALAFNKPVFAVLNEVELEPRSMRPVGSWLHDKRVLRCATMEEALQSAGYPEKTIPSPLRLFRFDRIRRGRVMAEGIAVHAATLEEATAKAKKMADPEDGEIRLAREPQGERSDG